VPAEAPAQHRFYADLAEWWPLISPADEYAEEARFAASLLGRAEIPVHEVVEFGSGGGSNAVHLKRHFAMTLVDLSPQMIEVSRRLNPDCTHEVGDMRTVRLGRAFDAVFIHDAVDYMVAEPDLRLTAETAFAHCRPGGVAVVVPDHTAETFCPGSDHGGSDAPDGRGVRYLEWSGEADPSSSVVTHYAFLLRDADGSVRVVHEAHETGLFGRETWLRVFTDAGFRVESVRELTDEPRVPREVFVAHRPAKVVAEEVPSFQDDATPGAAPSAP
jgi:trans-aconitate methyltransferase